MIAVHRHGGEFDGAADGRSAAGLVTGFFSSLARGGTGGGEGDCASSAAEESDVRHKRATVLLGEKK